MGDRGRRIAIAALMVFVLVTVSSVVYYVLGDGDWSMMDCVYMTLVTLSTVGFREALPINDIAGAQLFTMVLLVVGIGSVAYFLSAVTAFVVEGDLQEILGKRRMERRIARLSGHTLLIGIGRTGEYSAAQFVKGGHPVVLVDRDEASIKTFLSDLDADVPYVVGDGTKEGTLREAGIERAFGVVCAMDSDQSNLYAVLTARQLGPNLRIVSRAADTAAVDKLRLVGADAVVAPAEIGGLRLFAEMVRPEATTFLETLLSDHGRGVQVQSFAVKDGSALAGMTLAEANLRGRVGDILVLAGRPVGTANYQPARADMKLDVGTMLIVMGDGESLRGIRDLASAGGGRHGGKGAT